ncbi:MAG: spore coat U domain-containing protein [Myxococcota bacterium]
MPSKIVFIALFVFALNALSADCSFSIRNFNWGNIDLLFSTNASDIQGIFDVNCRNGEPDEQVRVCLNLSTGSGGMDASGDPRYMLNQSSQLAQLRYNLFSDVSRLNPWKLWTSPPPVPPDIVLTLDENGQSTREIPIYARLYGNQSSLPPGYYLSTFSGNQSQVVYGDTSNNCLVMFSQLTPTVVPFNVQMNYPPTCTVTTQPLNFGTIDFRFPTMGTTQIEVQCSNTMTYQISLNGGESGAWNPERRELKTPDMHVLYYGLYQDSAHMRPWGNIVNQDTVQGTGTGLRQSYTVYGFIPAQPDSWVGQYRDRVRVLVYY